jgi:hypothetical protein
METGKQRPALVFICRLLGALSAATALILTLTITISFFVVSKNARIVHGTFEQLTIDRVFVVFICLVAALVLFGVTRDVDLVTTLRWIAVLPAAVGAALGIQFLVILATTALSDWQVQLINSVAFGPAFVAGGAAMAPRHHYMTSLVLAVLFAPCQTTASGGILQP